MSQSRDELYLQHVLDASLKIERYAAVGYDEFMTESHWQDAVADWQSVWPPTSAAVAGFGIG